jgi:hypothetical protein
MQKIFPIVSAVLAAAALGIALFSNKEAPPPAAAAAQMSAQEKGEMRALERRVELLEESNSLLERKVFELSHLKLMLEDGGTAIAANALPSMADDARPVGRSAPAVGATDDSPIARSEIKEAVRAAQEEIATEQRKERIARFEQDQAKAQAAQAERWKKFTTEANLNGAQEQALNQALEAEQAKRKALMDDVRAGNKSFFEVRGDMRETRTATDQAMAKVLTPDQLTKYTETRQAERREGRGQGGPGGWGGPGGPGAPQQ